MAEWCRAVRLALPIIMFRTISSQFGVGRFKGKFVATHLPSHATTELDLSELVVFPDEMQHDCTCELVVRLTAPLGRFEYVDTVVRARLCVGRGVNCI
jgi:hypothetical protein